MVRREGNEVVYQLNQTGMRRQPRLPGRVLSSRAGASEGAQTPGYASLEASMIDTRERG
jgi:hypothetical protein